MRLGVEIHTFSTFRSCIGNTIIIVLYNYLQVIRWFIRRGIESVDGAEGGSSVSKRRRRTDQANDHIPKAKNDCLDPHILAGKKLKTPVTAKKKTKVVSKKHKKRKMELRESDELYKADGTGRKTEYSSEACETQVKCTHIFFTSSGGRCRTRPPN